MNVLGLSCYFHDAAAALVSDGVLKSAAEEERFSRIKHDFNFPERAIRFCLDHAGLTGSDLDYVVFFEKPLVKFERILSTVFSTVPRSSAVFRQAMTSWLLDKLWIKNRICEHIGVPAERVLFIPHHLSHAASAFFCSPFDRAAILTVDGVGEWTTTALGIGEGDSCRLTDEIRFPHSLGLLYSAFTAFLGFEVNEGEYKVMGMAPYGTPRYADKVWQVVRQSADGSFELDLHFFSFHYSATRSYSDRFVALFGPPRPPETPFFTAASGYPSYFGDPPGNLAALETENQRYADIAASIQLVTEELILGLARSAHAKTGCAALCMAGGVALNSVANGRILRETPFRELYVQPAAGDGGAAVGAALYASRAIAGGSPRFVMDHAYWGQAHTNGSIAEAIRQAGLPSIDYDDDERLVTRVVDLLTSKHVVGWSQDRFEWGPRSLGNRSILADPRDSEMKDTVNVKIKFREPYRPFAPSVPAEAASRYFDLPDIERQLAPRFMLMVAPVKEGAREAIPAVTHVDGSARVQTVVRDANPRFHQLITRFGEATGVPVLLNTSFNLRGEPIVNTPAEAINTFQQSGMDALVLDRTIVFKKGAERR
jgi:carbamoyltransferase